ncbi:Aromatic peroxygenase [Pseudohyphozyma bogoriensis]|nr:Aromatic peroxygenase [Pseudohyphozyma bogoriensis]
MARLLCGKSTSAALLVCVWLSAVSAFPSMERSRGFGNHKDRIHGPNLHLSKRSSAAPDVTSEYPYGGSVGGKPGTIFNGWKVPADGDPDHQWMPPGPDDITVFLTAAEFITNGDLETERITIGRPDYSWANSAGAGNHGEFEQDASIARDDKGITGDGVTLNVSSYKMSSDICQETTGGLWNYTIFGVIAKNDRKSFVKDTEWLPDYWFTRDSPYVLSEIAAEIAKMYALAPVPFGGNAGKVNSFDVLNVPGFTNGIPDDQTPEGLMCLLGNAILQNDLGANGSGGVLGPPLDPVRKAWAHAKLAPIFDKAFPSCNLLDIF